MPEVAEEQLSAAREPAAHGAWHDRYDPWSPGREEPGVDQLPRLAARGIRIGIDTGGAFHHGNNDYAAHGVDIAARIGSVAAAGEILVRRDALDGNDPSDALSQPPTLELKGLAERVLVAEWR